MNSSIIIFFECTKDNIEQRKNRFFVQGDPECYSRSGVFKNSREEIIEIAKKAEAETRCRIRLSFSLLFGDDTKKIWTLRKAGLGLLGNLPGDEKAVPVIEDTAVDVNDLLTYIRDFNEILKKYDLYSVHYAHAGSGEIHLRPIINLKTEEGNKLFRTIAEEIATLVKKYSGSLSGEHGDGRLRGEFIPQMVGEKNYQLLKQIKYTWDPENIFNPNKIVDTPSMNSFLRYTPGQKRQPLKRYSVIITRMCCNMQSNVTVRAIAVKRICRAEPYVPSFMATRNEKDTTRARANILREFLTRSDKVNRFDHKEIYEVTDLCLSCKGCKSECPSNVDVAKLKAEFLQQYYDANECSFPFKTYCRFHTVGQTGRHSSGFVQFSHVKNLVIGKLIKKFSGFAVDRSMPNDVQNHLTKLVQGKMRKSQISK